MAASPAGGRRPTRILLVTNMYPTADRPQTGAFVERRVAALRERGVDVAVVAPGDYRGGSLGRHLGITWRALTARGRFDGVEAHPAYVAGLIGLVAARLRRRPLLVYAHGGDVADYALRNRVHRTLAGLVVRHADAVVANSTDTAGFVQRLGANARIVSPGLDMDRFHPAQVDRADLRRRLGLPDGRLALFIGTFSERKGADLFAAAVAGAAGVGGGVAGAADATGKAAGATGWQGVMLGQGPLEAEIAAAHPTIRFHAPVPAAEVPDWLRGADVVVVPSRREPLGLAAVEAMACGTPVIAAATGGLKEVVRDGENGLLVPPEDVAAIAAALRRLEDADLRARLVAAGPSSVARHDIRKAAAQMGEIWQELGVRA